MARGFQFCKNKGINPLETRMAMKYSALFQSSKGREMGKELQQLSISCLLSFLFPLFASPLLQKMGADGLKMSRMASTCPGEFS